MTPRQSVFVRWATAAIRRFGEGEYDHRNGAAEKYPFEAKRLVAHPQIEIASESAVTSRGSGSTLGCPVQAGSNTHGLIIASSPDGSLGASRVSANFFRDISPSAVTPLESRSHGQAENRRRHCQIDRAVELRFTAYSSGDGRNSQCELFPGIGEPCRFDALNFFFQTALGPDRVRRHRRERHAREISVELIRREFDSTILPAETA